MDKVTQDPREPTFVADPHIFYHEARRRGEFVWWEDYGMPAALSHAAVSSALRDRRMARVPPGGIPPMPTDLAAFAAVESSSLLNLEGPDHARLRRAVLRRFTGARIDALEPRIADLCDGLIDRFPERPFDLISQFAAPIPVRVIADILGVPDEAAPNLLAWSRAIVGMYLQSPDDAARRAAESASAAFLGYLDGLLSRPDELPEEALLRALHAEERGGRISRAELLSTAILLLNAGHEATVHAIGNAARRLLETPGGIACAAPDRVDRAVEECLRLDAPLHLFTRWVLEETEIAGQRLLPGQEIALLLGAANRDPEVHAEPDTFRPGRSEAAITSFGAGVHFCLGAPLARLEMRIALARLFARCPGLRLSEPPQRADIYHFHGHDRLMVAA